MMTLLNFVGIYNSVPMPNYKVSMIKRNTPGGKNMRNWQWTNQPDEDGIYSDNVRPYTKFHFCPDTMGPEGLRMITSVPVSNDDLIQAIRLGISRFYGAMSIANALGGTPSIPWSIVRSTSLSELVADALDRGIDVKTIRASVDETPFMETPAYLRLREEIGGRTDFPK